MSSIEKILQFTSVVLAFPAPFNFVFGAGWNLLTNLYCTIARKEAIVHVSKSPFETHAHPAELFYLRVEFRAQEGGAE